MSARTLITGFGPFLDHAENPSAILAQGLGRDYAILEVSYEYVFDFWDSLVKSEQYDIIICLGLSAKATRQKLELFARNQVGDTLDVRGKTWPNRFIVEDGPPCLGATLMPPDLILAASGLLDAKNIELSSNAGAYLCNFLYYLLLAGHPGQVGFVHVPPFDVVPYETQVQTLAKLVVTAEALS